MAELIVTTRAGMPAVEQRREQLPTPGRSRLRRLRRTRTLRNLVAETSVGPDNLIMPHFVVPAKRANEPISSMPGIAQQGLEDVVKQIGKDLELGIRAVLLFGHPEHAAVSVIGVGAEAHVGHDDQLVAELALQALAGALHGAIGCRGRRAVGRLAAVLGVTEEQHGADAELEILADLLHDVLETLLRDAGHRRDRLVGALRRQHEVRHDQVVGADVRLGDEVA